MTARDESGGGLRFGSDGSLTLNESLVSGNSTLGPTGGGGGLYSPSGSVSLNNSSVSGNSTLGETRGYGGGIFTSSGSVSLVNSSVNENNTAGRTSQGGGIFTRTGSVSLTNSALSDNGTRSASGGGIFTEAGDVSLTSSTLSRNIANRGSGGGIVSQSGAVSLINSTVSENGTLGGSFNRGGGIFISSGSVSLLNSVVNENFTTGSRSHGGGISAGGFGNFGSVSLVNSTVSGNSTADPNSNGGGIYTFTNLDGVTTTIINSTISGNTTNGVGGGIANAEGLTVIENSTITGNQATSGGGVASSASDTRTEVSSTIIAGNTAAGSGNDVSAFSTRFGGTDSSFASLGNNLIGDGQFLSTDFFNNGNSEDIVGTTSNPVDPLLGPLADNGGPTLTHKLLQDSPAIDAGSNASAADLITDQRGSGFTRIEAGTVDIGSFELQPIQTAGQFVFYNNSSFDSASDSAAIATDKVALRNGETATFENYTSFIHGINGIAVDLLNSNSVVASDFQFSFGNSDDVDTFVPLASSTVTNLTTAAGAGVNGSDRVFIEFADGAITNGWLQVTVLANASTGLTNDEVFYFGNVIGESGNDPTNAIVNLSDISNARTNQTGFEATDVLNALDFNRDAVVNLADISIARTNQSGFTSISLITPTSSSETPSSKLPTAAASIGNTSVSLPISLATAELTTPELLRRNFSSFAVAATIQMDTTEPAKPIELKEALPRSPLALVGANLDTQSTQQDVLDQVFETTEQENDLANNIPLTDIDSFFETNFSAEL